MKEGKELLRRRRSLRQQKSGSHSLRPTSGAKSLRVRPRPTFIRHVSPTINTTTTSSSNSGANKEETSSSSSGTANTPGRSNSKFSSHFSGKKTFSYITRTKTVGRGPGRPRKSLPPQAQKNSATTRLSIPPQLPITKATEVASTSNIVKMEIISDDPNLSDTNTGPPIEKGHYQSAISSACMELSDGEESVGENGTDENGGSSNRNQLPNGPVFSKPPEHGVTLNGRGTGPSRHSIVSPSKNTENGHRSLRASVEAPTVTPNERTVSKGKIPPPQPPTESGTEFREACPLCSQIFYDSDGWNIHTWLKHEKEIALLGDTFFNLPALLLSRLSKGFRFGTNAEGGLPPIQIVELKPGISDNSQSPKPTSYKCCHCLAQFSTFPALCSHESRNHSVGGEHREENSIRDYQNFEIDWTQPSQLLNCGICCGSIPLPGIRNHLEEHLVSTKDRKSGGLVCNMSEICSNLIFPQAHLYRKHCMTHTTKESEPNLCVLERFVKELKPTIRLEWSLLGKTRPFESKKTLENTLNQNSKAFSGAKNNSNESNGASQLSCPRCQKCMVDMDSLLSHIEQRVCATSPVLQSCEICHKTFRTNFQRIRHNAVFHRSKEAEQAPPRLGRRSSHPSDDFTLRIDSSEANNAAVHVNGGIVPPERHLLTASSPLPQNQGSNSLACKYCGKINPSLAHKSRHEESKICLKWSTNCQICEKSFTRKDNLRAHLRDVHGIERTVDPTDPNLKNMALQVPHRCRFCKLQFPTEQRKDAHESLRKCTLLGFSCRLCQKKFSDRSAIVRHSRRVHNVRGGTLQLAVPSKENRVQSSGETPTPKVILGGSYGSGMERRAACKYCGKKFFSTWNRIQHEKKGACITSMKSYECGDCHKIYFNAKSLWMHRFREHGKKSADYGGKIVPSIMKLDSATEPNRSLEGLPPELTRQIPTSSSRTPPGQVNCHVCDNQYSCWKSLARHLRNRHQFTEDQIRVQRTVGGILPQGATGERREPDTDDRPDSAMPPSSEGSEPGGVNGGIEVDGGEEIDPSRVCYLCGTIYSHKDSVVRHLRKVHGLSTEEVMTWKRSLNTPGGIDNSELANSSKTSSLGLGEDSTSFLSELRNLKAETDKPGELEKPSATKCTKEPDAINQDLQNSDEAVEAKKSGRGSSEAGSTTSSQKGKWIPVFEGPPQTTSNEPRRKSARIKVEPK